MTPTPTHNSPTHSRRPRRIISLCPSFTETLFTLGLGDRIVGRTDYCCHPEPAITNIPSLGGPKSIRIEQIDALRPDLIVAVREENQEVAVRTLATRWPVLLLDPESVTTAIDSIRLLGTATGTSSAADRLADQITRAFDSLPDARVIPIAYLVWKDPCMVAGRSTFIDDVLARLGLVNVARSLAGRYPEVTTQQLANLQPRLLLASSEPFPFSEQHLDELRRLMPGTEPVLVDGEMFGWYGARMLAAADYFKRLIPQLIATAETRP